MSLHFERFAHFLTQTDHSPHTIRNDLCDLQTFAVWFEQTNSEALEPAQVTPTDLGRGLPKEPCISHCRASQLGCWS
jgi:hypothetical protein